MAETAIGKGARRRERVRSGSGRSGENSDTSPRRRERNNKARVRARCRWWSTSLSHHSTIPLLCSALLSLSTPLLRAAFIRSLDRLVRERGHQNAHTLPACLPRLIAPGSSCAARCEEAGGNLLRLREEGYLARKGGSFLPLRDCVCACVRAAWFLPTGAGSLVPSSSRHLRLRFGVNSYFIVVG